MSTTKIGYGFDIIAPPTGSRGRCITRFSCTGCPATHDLNFPNGGLSPDFQAARMQQKGWRAHSVRKSETLCPACLAAKRARKPEKENPSMAQPTPAAVPAPAPAPKLAIVPKQPTADQRLAIRNLLDKHFDDGVGCYLDGIDDQKVAERVGVPRLIVEQIRDAGWGPVKVNPEMVALRAEVAALKAELEKQSADVAKAYSDGSAAAMRAYQGLGIKLDALLARVEKAGA